MHIIANVFATTTIHDSLKISYVSLVSRTIDPVINDVANSDETYRGDAYANG